MKHLPLLALLGLLVTPALAQQAPQPQQDPAIGICQQLSLEKESRLMNVIVQAQALAKQLDATKAELEGAAKARDAATAEKTSLANELESTKAELARLKDTQPITIAPRAAQ